MEEADYIKGGSQQIADHLRNYIETNGGTVRIRRRVVKITFDGDRVGGVVDHRLQLITQKLPSLCRTPIRCGRSRSSSMRNNWVPQPYL